jgi:hypothetical protein
MRHITRLLNLIILTIIVTSCAPTSLISETILSISAISTATISPSLTLPKAATATNTALPTVTPLFSIFEVESASSFDISTWPERFHGTQLHPEKATELEWQEEFQFLLAVREKAGISETASYAEHINSQLPSLWNCARWQQDHLDEVKARNMCVISPVEYRAMIEETRTFKIWHDKDGATYGGLEPVSDIQNYSSEFIGPILGQDISTQRHTLSDVYGKLAGFGTIGEQNVILIDMKDKDGYHVLLPVVVYKDGITLVKGTKCLVIDMNYSNRHDGSPLFILPTDVELPPDVSWNPLLDGLGRIFYVQGGYSVQLYDKFNISSIHCFTPTLNLEMAGVAGFASNMTTSSSPWTER